MLDSQKQTELDTLIHKLVDGEIGPFEFQRLNDLLLHDKDAQRHYLHHADMVNTIRWQLTGEATQQSIVALKSMRDTAPLPAADAIPERPTPPRFSLSRFALRLRSIDVRYAAAAAIVLGVTFIGMLIASRMQTASRIASTGDLVIPVPQLPPAPPEPKVALVPKVEQRSGDVQVSNRNPDPQNPGNPQHAIPHDVEVATNIEPGQTIETRGAESSTVLAYEDKTNIVIGNDTTFTVEKATHKRITLDGGSLAANVSPQPASKPMIIVTPHAEIQVVGTRFSVETEPNLTKLSVTEGTVRIRLVQQDDGEWIEVPAGKYALAEPIKNMVSVDSIPKLPETWTEDFEQGLPVGWRKGTLVKDGCCNEGHRSVMAQRVDTGNNSLYQIGSQIKWSEGEGLFQIHPDTHVHLLLKVNNPGIINVYLSTRSAGAIPDPSLFIFKDLHKHITKKHAWFELTIPMHAFQRRLDPNRHPQDTDMPLELMLSSFDDRGLVVDKIWVTQSGRGKVDAIQRK